MKKGNLVSIEERIPKLKQQRKKRANRRLTLILLLFFVVLACIIYFQSPLSHVSTITIIGNNTYSTKELMGIIEIDKNTNIWTVPKDGIIQRLENLSEVKEAHVKTVLPNKVEIKIVELKRVAVQTDGTAFHPILENGRIVTEADNTAVSEDVPILVGFSDKTIIQEMVQALTQLPDEVYNAISEIHYTPKETDEKHISLYMNDGFEVSATLSSFAEKMVLYPAIRSQLNNEQKGIIDLEVGSYFKAYGEEGEDTRENEGDR
ncbi:FtsQ-type POTRA domain-containing protein [Bacillaceae bacterium Marseille-Q3522]|nr:FtsQ-type POTRA domain-containing protein [Bacillaceae bacterium Marseille-Q3522]